MATAREWFAAARPRTLPAAIAPVVVGTALSSYYRDAVWWKAFLALVVALALQIGVNYANDYSDGIRGTDDARVGPMRLVGARRATPRAVLLAAGGALAVAAAAGLILAANSNWWLLAVGVAAMLAAWFYTGGRRPYGYLALGEVMVFVFFGLVAVAGTTYVQIGRIPEAAWYAGSGVGALACAILVVNNLRDRESDQGAGKHTLAVLLGEDRTRGLYVLLIAAAAAMIVAMAMVTSWRVLTGLGFILVVAMPVRAVTGRAAGSDLIPVLQRTSLAELAWAVLVSLAMWSAAVG
ncbi:MAG: 1,4-dihydroxy-2-naphthoate polyprenyltransferase [Nocardioides sp.]